MSEKIDVERVERELVSALAADRKYSRENDAKIRAVTQRVATYDEFREIVKGSHLRPLEKKDTSGRGGFRQPWNPAVSDRGGVEGREEGEEVTLGEGGAEMSLQSFMREWRRLAAQPQDQYRFLVDFGRDRLSKLFRVEISMGLLGEILTILNKHLEDDDDIIGKVLRVLEVLSQSSRFKLSLGFLSKSEKQASRELFEKLADSRDKLLLKQLHTMYGH
ncbi:Coiled-coil domain-containing protein 103 [Geodia barretti]|uniref:Coiled-coil domain-containing protein 103 n=1 Tax=Geodia barretti TaxID=519541 RepID=A0AA35RF46_GEOBA|nr:Coiled-coil domain-containing protein 103 [Geodia barretti]